MKQKNKGYTLVEMIIVIAIMAILSAVSIVTLNTIKTAKCTAAINTLQEQMGNLLVQTKALSSAKTNRMCMVLDTSNAYSGTGLVIGTDAAGDGSTFTAKSTKPAIAGKGDLWGGFAPGDAGAAEAVLPDLVTITYTPSPSNQKASGISGDIVGYIEFNKSDGSVKYGAGKYEFTCNGKLVGTVYLDATTGNRYVK